MVIDARMIDLFVNWTPVSMEALVLKVTELLYRVIARRDLKVTSVKLIALSAKMTLVSMKAPVLRVLAL